MARRTGQGGSGHSDSGEGERRQEAPRHGQGHSVGGFRAHRDLRDRAQDHLRLIGYTIEAKARRDAAGPSEFYRRRYSVSASISGATAGIGTITFVGRFGA